MAPLRLNFLNKFIDQNGFSPLPGKAEAVENFSVLTFIRLWRFIGRINYYRHFISNSPSILLPLTNLLKKKQKHHTQQDAIHLLNTATAILANITKLSYLNSDENTRIFLLTMDASNTAIGSLIEQEVDSVRKPIFFFLAKLTRTQTNYGTFPIELLTIYWVIKQFRHKLECRKFVIYRDHKPPTHASNWCADKRIPREKRYLDFITRYKTDIRYIKGQKIL